ncbi:hypothetical protein O5O45_02965 [Hahella aquimaris]|uniref:hypothetical protein n=1 Tax=Hahella sp. HNIBRBA332 TaxID=3015983 RepID=UPI00273CAD17|nr:hypothetical protein [Hahella sp. HNIBRBA332]WLQ14897.1 hypothetical protein O5O45_02965 [Hahella sp. HNIBRBA332]
MKSKHLEDALFLDIEASSPDDDAYPICIAWTDPDGAIQKALIIPEDDWEDWDFGYQHSHGLSREHLFEQGETGKDVIRALSSDLAEATVYVDGLDPDAQLLERLFEAFDADMPFELARITDFLPELDFETFLERRQEILLENGLSGFNAENNVFVMAELTRRLR